MLNFIELAKNFLVSELQNYLKAISFHTISTVHGQSSVVKLLLAKSAAADSKDKQGRTAASRALESGDKEVARLLLEHGVDPILYRCRYYFLVRYAELGR